MGKNTTVAMMQIDKVKAEQITKQDINKMVKDAITLAGGFDFIKNREFVVIKPNLISTRTSVKTMNTMIIAMISLC